MSAITFIDFNEAKDQQRSRIKSHAQSARYRRERLLAAQQHQSRVEPQSSKSATHITRNVEDVSNDSGASGQGSGSSTPTKRHALGPAVSKQRQRKKLKPKPAAQLLTPPTSSASPVAIVEPDGSNNMQLVLSKTSQWIEMTYQTSWADSIKQDPLIYDFDNGIETLRDSFMLASDLVLMGSNPAAFEAINTVLDSVPSLLRSPHPELLFCLVELGVGTLMKDVPAVRAMVKEHIVGLANIMFGPTHPMASLLHFLFTRDYDMRSVELMFTCILDTMKRTLGPSNFQTLIADTWQAQFYASIGRQDLGSYIAKVARNACKKLHGEGSSLSLIADYEACLQDQKMATADAGARKLNTLLRLEEALGVSEKLEDPFSYGNGQNSQVAALTTPSLSLARYLLDKKRYALAMQVYSTGNEGPGQGDYVPPNLARNTALSTKLVQIAGSALGIDDKMALHSIVHNRASPISNHLHPQGANAGIHHSPSGTSSVSSPERRLQPPLLPNDPVLARFVKKPP